MCRRVRSMTLRLKLVSGCRRATRLTLRLLAWVPVLIVTLVLIWGYYVYVYVMNISGTFPKGSPVVSAFVSVVLLLVAHVLLAFQLVSYLRTIFCKHRPVPSEFCLSEDQLEQLDHAVDDQDVLRELSGNLRVIQRNKCGGIRYCESCELIKPDRCHHCSICDRCVLKMDHHCPWVNNCVGHSNYKFFVLFLLYTVLLCGWFSITGLYDFIRAWNKTLDLATADKFNVIFCYFVCALFGLSTGSLFIFHIYLSLFNRTTLENMQWPRTVEGSDRRLFFLGFRTNLKQVYGGSCLLALFPVASWECDGVHFPTKCRNIELGSLTSPLSGEGVAEGEEERLLDSEEHPLTSTLQI